MVFRTTLLPKGVSVITPSQIDRRRSPEASQGAQEFSVAEMTLAMATLPLTMDMKISGLRQVSIEMPKTNWRMDNPSPTSTPESRASTPPMEEFLDDEWDFLSITKRSATIALGEFGRGKVCQSPATWMEEIERFQ